MRFGAQFKPENWRDLVTQLRMVEDYGYSRIYMVDGQLLWRDLYVYMSHALAATERIPVASAVTNQFTRHSTVTANAHASLAELYPGRVVLGIGRGDSAVRTLGAKPVATSRLEDVVSQLRDLMAGRPTVVDGQELRSLWGPQQEVPIMMAGTGPRNLQLAGSLADIVMIQVGANPESCKWAVDNIRAGAHAAGRSIAEVQVVAHCAISISDDMVKARRETRWIVELVGIHAGAVAKNSAGHRMPPPLMRLADQRMTDHNYSSYLDSKVERRPYPDDVIDDVALIGSPEDIVARVRALAEVGVDEIAPAYLNGQSDQIRLIGEQLIPQFS